MKVYALKAHGERGKSTTLKKLIVYIFHTFPDAKVISTNRAFTLEQCIAEIEKERFDRRKSCNHCTVENIQIVLEVNGKKVGINTAGDNVVQVRESIKLFNGNHCDVGFCACRSKGETIKELEKVYASNIEFIQKAEILGAWEYKNFHDWIDMLNDWQAKELLPYVK